MILKMNSIEASLNSIGLSLEQAQWIALSIILLSIVIYGIKYLSKHMTCPNCGEKKRVEVIKTTITPEKDKTTNYKTEKQTFLGCKNCNHKWSYLDEGYLNV